MTDLRLIVAHAAQRDIENIGQFIAQDDRLAATRFVERFTVSNACARRQE